MPNEKRVVGGPLPDPSYGDEGKELNIKAEYVFRPVGGG